MRGSVPLSDGLGYAVLLVSWSLATLTHSKHDLLKEEERSGEGQNGEWLAGSQTIEDAGQTGHEQGLRLANQVPRHFLHETSEGDGRGQERHVEEDDGHKRLQRVGGDDLSLRHYVCN